jgi:Flp pilus assembly protein TadD
MPESRRREPPQRLQSAEQAGAAEALVQGEARYRAGAYDEAAAIFARLCDANPGDPDPVRLLGLCRLRLGDPSGALTLLAKARALAPADPYAQLHYGLGLHAVGRHAEAAAQFRACTLLVPNDPAPFLNLAAALLALGDHRKALDAAKWARRRAPNMPQASWDISTWRNSGHNSASPTVPFRTGSKAIGLLGFAAAEGREVMPGLDRGAIIS